MKTAKDCGPLGECVAKVAEALTPAFQTLRAERPTLEIVFVVIPGGDIAGAGTCSSAPLVNVTSEDAYAHGEHIQNVLRRAAESALAQLCKEACRRAHATIVRRSTVAQA